jgi:prolyl oligopeptidase
VKLIGSPKIIRKDFECQEIMVPSHDGEEVPMNLYYKGTLTKDRRNKVLLEAYGAYGLNMS